MAAPAATKFISIERITLLATSLIALAINVGSVFNPPTILLTIDSILAFKSSIFSGESPTSAADMNGVDIIPSINILEIDFTFNSLSLLLIQNKYATGMIHVIIYS
ncbi:hypothetical protein [Edwardsiella anguillarum]|nr:hypothetical protein [Edwardsiella anguillarum]WHP82420.1 hypothetical protein MQ095_11445 [Edwardsiella anguillarum]WHP86219.1 hypothetical protein MQ088_11450 [Edwardsiella anguillarum]WHP90017.1 hypothetical protein MQ091_11445 [Edwardsiella anguillarum]WHP93815.1 hypothetical protein MQ096_11450 [Edwardsiella anguillarum]WHP97675.1 hypothetical protein MQ082_11440 [Edwardsiella anguillarum]